MIYTMQTNETRAATSKQGGHVDSNRFLHTL